MNKLSLSTMAFIVFVFCAATAIVSPAQTFTSLASFDYTNGAYPEYMSLVEGFDGDFYGTTYGGGANGNYGTVFKITPAGTLTTLYSFDYDDSYFPVAGLVQASNGDFYGTTYQGGASGGGTVFKITPGGTLTTLHSFDYDDGYYPAAGLVQASNGDFYGTTLGGGGEGYGTVFKITPGGTLTSLHSFDSSDGAFPWAGLLQATNGDFYGTTSEGGMGYGTVFKITPGGTLTTLHSFDYDDGYYPAAGLVQASNGDFYGTTEGGGARYHGTVFKITPGGTLTTLYSFCALTYCADGEQPSAGLVQATDGNFYGTTAAGGTGPNYGTVFKITPGGTLTTLYSFCALTYCADGEQPSAGLVQATDGAFYGTTFAGGSSSNCTGGCGTVFSLSVGLGPFVETRPTSGKVGAKVIILGTNLTGATSVSFNGTAATFTVVSGFEITTTVPTGATTGTVEVTTPSGTLKSNVAFRVP